MRSDFFNASVHCYYPPAGGGGGYDSSPFLSGVDGLLSECLRVLAEQLKCHSDRQQGRSTHRAPESLLYSANPTDPEHTEGRQEQMKDMGEPKRKKKEKKEKATSLYPAAAKFTTIRRNAVILPSRS